MYVTGLGGPNTEGLQRDIKELLNDKATEGWELALITPLPFAVTVAGPSGIGLSTRAQGETVGMLHPSETAYSVYRGMEFVECCVWECYGEAPWA